MPEPATSAVEVLPSYDRPPVQELVIGCRFDPPKDQYLPHVGAYWTTVRDRFPVIQHHEPLVLPGEQQALSIDKASGVPLPRIWLMSQDSSRVLQLQIDTFILNWRKVNGSVYPRFRPTFDEFYGRFKEYAAFMKDVGAGELTPKIGEVSYNNLLTESDAGVDVADDVERALQYMGQPVTKSLEFLGRPRQINWQIGYRLPKGGALTVKLSHGTRSENPKRRMIMLELSTIGSLASKGVEDIAEWYEHAHVAIVKTFAEVTAPEVQRSAWGLHE